jgi:hypothetical protein
MKSSPYSRRERKREKGRLIIAVVAVKKEDEECRDKKVKSSQ